jgi:integrase
MIRQSLKTRDRRVATMRAGQLVEKDERKASGLADPFEEHRERPLAEHVEDFLSHLASRGVSKGHHEDRALCLRQYLEATRARTLARVDLVEAQRWLHELTGRLSARSVNKRYQALRQFGSWLVRARRLGYDPFQGLTPRNEETDRRRVRRALTDEEAANLLAAARERPLGEAREHRVNAGVSAKEERRLLTLGETRGFLYAFALGTGLRRGELAGLRWADIDGERGEVTVRATIATSKRTQALPLRAVLVAGLGEHRGRMAQAGHATGAQDLVFPSALFPTHRTFGADLARAGLDGEDDQGRIVDFHSLRTTFITRLSVAGVHPRVAQALARHSKIDLTMRVYTDVRLLDLRAAVESAVPASPPDETLSA